MLTDIQMNLEDGRRLTTVYAYALSALSRTVGAYQMEHTQRSRLRWQRLRT